MKKLIYIIYFIITLLLMGSVMAVTGDVTRTVSDLNPSFGDTIIVTLSITLTDTDTNPSNQWFIIREPKPTWTYTLGDFQLDASESNIMSIVKLDQSTGLKTYSYTVTAPSTASTLSFSGGQYDIGEGQQSNGFTSIGGTTSISVGGGGPISNEPSTPSSTTTSFIRGSPILIIALIGAGIYIFMKLKK